MILALYIVTLALHAAFIGYVVGGTAFVLLRPHDPMSLTVRDRLPFMLGAGITAGVAPLLFIQLLYQHRFYTANLLLGPRWLAVVPVLITGFYALYLQKVSPRWRKLSLAVALACFAFVAWSWSELHELMMADKVWHDFYAAGDRMYLAGSIAPRLAILYPAMATLFAMIAAWSADDQGRRRLAVVALCARLVSIGGAIWLWQIGFANSPWIAVLAFAVVVEIGAWLAMWRRPSDLVLSIVTAAGTIALLAATIAREAPRLSLVEPSREADGWIVFAIAAAIGVAAIVYVIRLARGAGDALLAPDDTSDSP
jgi:hypothetical protein